MNKENRMKTQILLIFPIIIILFCLKFFFLNYNNISFERCEFGINRFEQEFFNIEGNSFDIEFINCKNKFPSFFTDTTLDFKNDVFLNDTLRLVLDSVDSDALSEPSSSSVSSLTIPQEERKELSLKKSLLVTACQNSGGTWRIQKETGGQNFPRSSGKRCLRKKRPT